MRPIQMKDGFMEITDFHDIVVIRTYKSGENVFDEKMMFEVKIDKQTLLPIPNNPQVTHRPETVNNKVKE